MAERPRDSRFAEPQPSSASGRFPAAERPRAVAPETYMEAVRGAQQQRRRQQEQRAQRDPEHDADRVGPRHSVAGALASRSSSGGLRTLSLDPPRVDPPRPIPPRPVPPRGSAL